MRLMLHTLRKDARRLWPAAGVTWLMLAVLAHADRWRADWIPSPLEGWMNLLLPLAWACLVCLAVLEEPLIGDRDFWMTRPHRWPELLAAKLLFSTLAVQLPLLLAEIYILAARGFSPAAYFPQLLWKQALVFGAVILPSLAIASVLRNFTQFVVAVLLIAAALAILNGGFETFPVFTRQSAALRHTLEWLVLAAGALAVIWMQYASRRGLPARLVAAVAAIAAICVSTLLPVRAEYAVPGKGLRPAPRISLGTWQIADIPQHPMGSSSVVASVPITISGAADGYTIPMVEAEVILPDGTTFRSTTPNGTVSADTVLVVSMDPWPMFATVRGATFGPPGRLALRLSANAWERVKNVPVRIRGSMAFEFHRTGAATAIPSDKGVFVAGVGRCTSSVVQSLLSNDMLKVLCESPDPLPETLVTLRQTIPEWTWERRLNSAYTLSRGPRQTWLSPLYRGQSFFHLTNRVDTVPGGRWLVPETYLATLRIEVAPQLNTGHALSHFDFANVRLAR